MQHIFEWRMILDITLITALIYSIGRTLRATGTWKIALGLLFVGIVAAIARLLNLQGIEWIFSNLTQIALIGLLIIFQPEIRRILERSFLLGRISVASEDTRLPELMDKVLFSLAEKRWGALVVLPGELPVRQWTTEGVRIDALPSFPLLLSIFDPFSPGHDGAVIVDGNRISRFGVHLPLSQTNRLGREYGTRHSAAMGLAENTDALVFAVSEERGKITAFRNGEMRILNRPGDVAKIMVQHAAVNAPVVNVPVKGKDFWMKTVEISVSLGIAMLMWTTLIQSGTEIREMLYTVPIEYGNPAKNIMISGKQAEAKLLIQGPLATLRNLDTSQLRVQVDVSKLATGKKRISLENADISIPGKLRLVEVHPESFELELKEVVTVNIPVKPQLIGKLPAGYKLTNFQVSPASIPIVVTPGEAKKIGALRTSAIYLSELRESTQVICKILIPEGLLPQEKKWPDVEVHLTVAAEN